MEETLKNKNIVIQEDRINTSFIDANQKFLSVYFKEYLCEVYLNKTITNHKKLNVAIELIKEKTENNSFISFLDKDFNDLKEYLILVLENIKESDEDINFINNIQNTKESLNFLISNLKALYKEEFEKFQKLSFRDSIKNLTLEKSKDFSLDYQKAILKIYGVKIKLTFAENEMFNKLFLNPDELITYTYLTGSLNQNSDDGNSAHQRIKKFHSKVREKLLENKIEIPKNFRILKNENKLGYRLEDKFKNLISKNI